MGEHLVHPEHSVYDIMEKLAKILHIQWGYKTYMYVCKIGLAIMEKVISRYVLIVFFNYLDKRYYLDNIRDPLKI